MIDFIKKYKQELKRPGLYIVIAIFIFAVAYRTNNLNSPLMVMFGGGTLVFAVRDIVALVLKEKNIDI
ncbi:hypothetical protein IMX26_09420 [Clostridium sp. 'deep sea']|uniref:hypothetical protein n=1 Tax=Clostridium sp. 'deep sea' TaxID=2779445 RepID=UPI0018965E27|nr:hypothetical protein [Clostridium sp. 'deep sea']QOR33720.1 hypothetical protein IMX26_09420 [Clostridium sp. 'deep sea']